jgi:hypothetical protein
MQMPAGESVYFMLGLHMGTKLDPSLQWKDADDRQEFSWTAKQISSAQGKL